MRRLSIDDVDACMDVGADREWMTQRAQWLMMLQAGRGYGFEDGGELCGTVIIFPYNRVSFVGMLLIRRRVGRRGCGGRLLEYALNDTRSSAAALFATSFGIPLYTKMGFIEREKLVTHRGRLTGAPDRSVSVRSPSDLSKAEIARIIAADTDAFGSPRPELIHGWMNTVSHVAMLLDRGNFGYAMVTHKEDASQFGPVVAFNDDCALALISSLAAVSDRECKVHVPGRRAIFRERLKECGLLPVRELPMMTRGSFTSQNDSWYAVGSKATG